MAQIARSTTRLDPALRKAAILVACLEPPLADRLLEHLPAEQAARIRRLAVELDDVEASEQAAVLGEFVASRGREPGPGREHAVAAQTTSAVQPSPPAAPVSGGGNKSGTAADEDVPFRFLRHTPGSQLARLLAVERPQTIALVLAHLPEADAARTLAALPPELHLPVARRLAELEETSPEVLREVEQGLVGRMAQFQLAGARRALGLNRLRGILQAGEPGWSRDVLDALSAEDPLLAAELQAEPPPPTAHQADADHHQSPTPHSAAASPPDLDTLAALTDRELRELLSQADPELVMLALAGASRSLARRCLALLEPPLARHIEQSLSRLGPLRLADIFQAQAELLALRQASAPAVAPGP